MEDVLDLLAFIAENMGKGEGVERIREVLREKGYTESEINLAFNYLLLTFGAHQKKSGWTKTRVLHPVENMFISPEAYGHVLRLRALKIIDDSQLEGIIEEALMQMERIVGIDEIKKAAYKILFRSKETDYVSPSTDKDEEDLPIH